MIHLAVPTNEAFGAGTCGSYLLREFAQRGEVTWHPMGENDPWFASEPLTSDVDHPLIQFAGPNLEQQTKYRGTPNVGYVFSEWAPLTKAQRENLKAFDVLVAGSEWNAQVIRDAGFECSAVPQGVDREIFHPRSRSFLKDKFVIYSGGKWESRKAQDLVIRAVKILQDRHKDILLMASWRNIFSDADGYSVAAGAGLKFIAQKLLSHRDLAVAMAQTDVGLFPNRREGGTNLVLMDYLAMGKPVVANASTGQRDVLDNDWAFMADGDDDAQVEAMVRGVEALYYDQERLARMGAAADKAMNLWPWSRTAEGLAKACELVVA